MNLEEMRLRLAESSSSLRGVAAALRLASNNLVDDDAAEAAILDLLARDVDREAETTGDAEALLNGATLRVEAHKERAGKGPTRPKDDGASAEARTNVSALRSRAGGLDKTEGS